MTTITKATATVVVEGEEYPHGVIERGAVKAPEGKIPVTLTPGGEIIGWADGFKRDGDTVLMDITLVPMEIRVPNGEADADEVPFRTEQVDPPWSVEQFDVFPMLAPYEGARRKKDNTLRVTSGVVRQLLVGLKGANPGAHIETQEFPRKKGSW